MALTLELQFTPKLFTLLGLCVSFLRTGHANIFIIVSMLTDDPRRESTLELQFIDWAQTNATTKARHPQMPSEGLSVAWLQTASLLNIARPRAIAVLGFSGWQALRVFLSVYEHKFPLYEDLG